jgi:hypothetical protein
VIGERILRRARPCVCLLPQPLGVRELALHTRPRLRLLARADLRRFVAPLLLLPLLTRIDNFLYLLQPLRLPPLPFRFQLLRRIRHLRHQLLCLTVRSAFLLPDTAAFAFSRVSLISTRSAGSGSPLVLVTGASSPLSGAISRTRVGRSAKSWTAGIRA